MRYRPFYAPGTNPCTCLRQYTHKQCGKRAVAANQELFVIVKIDFTKNVEKMVKSLKEGGDTPP